MTQLEERRPFCLQVAEVAEEVLRGEEAKKDKLCQELNLLVQQSAHAQLERLEQLTHRMESLNRGFIQSTTSNRPAPEPYSDAQRQCDASQPDPPIESSQGIGHVRLCQMLTEQYSCH